MPHIRRVSQHLYPKRDTCQTYVTYIRYAHDVYCTDKMKLADVFACKLNHTGIEVEKIPYLIN